MAAIMAALRETEQSLVKCPPRMPAPSIAAPCRNGMERLLQLSVAYARPCLPEAWTHAARCNRNILAALHFTPTLQFLNQVRQSADLSTLCLRRLRTHRTRLYAAMVALTIPRCRRSLGVHVELIKVAAPARSRRKMPQTILVQLPLTAAPALLKPEMPQTILAQLSLAAALALLIPRISPKILVAWIKSTSKSVSCSAPRKSTLLPISS